MLLSSWCFYFCDHPRDHISSVFKKNSSDDLGDQCCGVVALVSVITDVISLAMLLIFIFGLHLGDHFLVLFFLDLIIFGFVLPSSYVHSVFFFFLITLVITVEAICSQCCG
jgi:hypothetical protein